MMTTTTASQANSAYVNTSFHSTVNKQQPSNFGKYNYYQVLELPNFASIEQVKLAYRELAKRWHPDFHLENKEVAQEAEERFKAINMAYVTLKSSETKALYDDKLRLLLEKIATYMAKKDPAYIVPTTTAPNNPVPPPNHNETTFQTQKNGTPTVKETAIPIPTVAGTTVEQPQQPAAAASTTQAEQLKTDANLSQTEDSSHFKRKIDMRQAKLHQTMEASPTTETIFKQTKTSAKPRHEKIETQATTMEIEAEPSITVRREKIPPPIARKNGVVTELESSMPHHDFLTRLRYCLHPPQPVLLFTKEKSEVEGVLNLSGKQAKEGKSIRLQLDVSHCEKFNLPKILQLQLPKNLQEGQRLKITEDAWQEEGTKKGGKGNLSKIKTLNLRSNSTAVKGNQSLVLVVHIQEDGRSLLSKILAFGGVLNANPSPKKPLFPSSAPAMESPQAELAGTMINPTIIEEKITIPLPLAILGGIYAFTSTTGETLQVPISSGIEVNSILNVAGRDNTLFEITVAWQLPNPSTLSSDEKRLYETLMLITLTEEERIKEAIEATENEQTAEAE